MRKFFAITFSILPLTGCVGIGAIYPTDRPLAQMPEFGPDIGEYYPRINYYRSINPGSLKCSELMAQWGPPNNLTVKGEEKTLTYKHGLVFAGLVPFIVIPIPLVLPVGRKSAVITCHEEQILNALGTATKLSGAVCGIGTFVQGGGTKDAFACSTGSP